MIPREYSYAGFWVRAAARITDVVAILGIYNFFYIVDRVGTSAGLWAPGSLEGFPAVTGRTSLGDIARASFFLGFPVFYSVYLHGAFGQTFGKMAFRIVVINEDGSPVTYGIAFLRWLSYFLCDLTLFLGYILAAFDKRKQGLHDKVCGTLVIRS